MFIQNTQYRFCDSSISESYDVAFRDGNGAGLLCFDKSGVLIRDYSYKDVAFRKRESID